MWSLAASLLSWILGLFGFGKPDQFKQGQDAGKAEAGQIAATGEISDVQAAQAARESVAADLNTSPDKLRQPDKFERP